MPKAVTKTAQEMVAGMPWNQRGRGQAIRKAATEEVARELLLLSAAFPGDDAGFRQAVQEWGEKVIRENDDTASDS